jgi:hypothetical protein
VINSLIRYCNTWGKSKILDVLPTSVRSTWLLA